MTRSSVDCVALDERRPRTPVGQVELRGKRAGADLRAAEILQRGDGLLLRVARLAQAREPRAVLLVRAVREVEARDVHARVDERARALRASRTRGRACRRAWRGGSAIGGAGMPASASRRAAMHGYSQRARSALLATRCRRARC